MSSLLPSHPDMHPDLQPEPATASVVWVEKVRVRYAWPSFFGTKGAPNSGPGKLLSVKIDE